MRLRSILTPLLAAASCLLAACEGNSPLERSVDRFLRESGQGLLSPTGEVQNLSFPDQSGLVHVVVRNIEGDVRIRGQRQDASGPTTVRLRPRATVGTNFAARQELDQVQWDAQMKEGPGGSRVLEVSIRTKDPKAWFLRCDMEIDTPRLGRADVVTDHGRVLVEDNRIGDSAASTVRAAMRSKRGDVAAESLPILEIHAWRGKGSRAEPVSTLWKRGLVHIVGQLPDLEEEMTTWNPTKTAMSPNRIDAMVHGVTVLAGLDDDDAPEPDDYESAKAPGRFAHDGPAEQRYNPDEWEDDE